YRGPCRPRRGPRLFREPPKTNWPARGRPEGYLWGIELLAQVVRSGERTPGGWGDENYRSLHRTEPSEATARGSPSNVAPEGPKKGEIVEFTSRDGHPYLAVKGVSSPQTQGLATGRRASDHDGRMTRRERL